MKEEKWCCRTVEINDETYMYKEDVLKMMQNMQDRIDELELKLAVTRKRGNVQVVEASEA